MGGFLGVVDGRQHASKRGRKHRAALRPVGLTIVFPDISEQQFALLIDRLVASLCLSNFHGSLVPCTGVTPQRPMGCSVSVCTGWSPWPCLACSAWAYGWSG